MANCENITGLVYKALEKEEAKIAKKVFKWLDKDFLNIVVYDGEAFAFEANAKMPNYVYKYLRRYIAKMGYKYIFENIPL